MIHPYTSLPTYQDFILHYNVYESKWFQTIKDTKQTNGIQLKHSD